MQSLTILDGTFSLPSSSSLLAFALAGSAEAEDPTCAIAGTTTTTTTATSSTQQGQVSTTAGLAEGSEDSSSASGSIVVVAAGAAGGFLLLVIVIILVACRRRRTKTQVSATPSTTGPLPSRYADAEAGGARPTEESKSIMYENPTFGGDADDGDDRGKNDEYLTVAAASSPPAAAAPRPDDDPYAQLKDNMHMLLTTVLAPLLRKTQQKPLAHLACPRPLRRKHLKLVQYLSEGNYGEVWKGSFYDEREEVEDRYDVAIKRVKDADKLARTEPDRLAAEVRGLQSEACLHAMLDSPFVVSLVGIAPAPKGEVTSAWLVLELMSEGSLQGMLKKRHADGTLSITDQLQWAGDAAQGLRFLHDKDILHRDVAARNVLATMDAAAGRICCKISDLGLSREIRGEAFELTTPEDAPVAWRAPETFQTGIFTKAGDVYSFGIFLWEVLSAVGFPFAGQCTTHDELRQKIVGGSRPRQPDTCPSNVFDLMTECWVDDVSLRPSMSEVVTRLNRLWKRQSNATTDAPAAPHRANLPAVQLESFNLYERPQLPLYDLASEGSTAHAAASPGPYADADRHPNMPAVYDLASDSSTNAHVPPFYDKASPGRHTDAGRHPNVLPPYDLASENANTHVPAFYDKASPTPDADADRHPLQLEPYLLPNSVAADADA